mgnify:CR=1 FL=1
MTKPYKEFLKDVYQNLLKHKNNFEEMVERAEEYAKQEEEELKAKLPTEEEIKKLFDKFQLMVNGKCIGIPTWNYDDLAKSIRLLIIEKENRMEQEHWRIITAETSCHFRIKADEKLSSEIYFCGKKTDPEDNPYCSYTNCPIKEI